MIPSDAYRVDDPLTYSIVIAAYRRPQLLCQTLDHLMPQVGTDGEVIVIEQCPIVDLKSKYEMYPRLRYCILPLPGTVIARNHGIRIARGDIVIFVDDDVIPPLGFISAHLKPYSDPTIGGVAGRVIDSSHKPANIFDPRSLDPIDGWRWTTYDHTHDMDVSHAPTCNLSLRRSAIVQVGGFDPFFRLAWREDSDLCFRVRALGYRIRFSADAWLIHLSASEGGTRSTGTSSVGTRISRMTHIYRKQYHHYRDNLYFILRYFHGRKRLRWIVDAYLTYVGLSRWPWHWVVKNLCFLVALWFALKLNRYRRSHPLNSLGMMSPQV